jgi:hypothetical protein
LEKGKNIEFYRILQTMGPRTTTPAIHQPEAHKALVSRISCFALLAAPPGAGILEKNRMRMPPFRSGPVSF